MSILTTRTVRRASANLEHRDAAERAGIINGAFKPCNHTVSITGGERRAKNRCARRAVTTRGRFRVWLLKKQATLKENGIKFGLWMIFTVAIGFALGRHDYDNFIDGAITAAPLTVLVIAAVNRFKRRTL
jgi:hypothetical protein